MPQTGPSGTPDKVDSEHDIRTNPFRHDPVPSSLAACSNETMPYVDNAGARIYFESYGGPDRPALVLAHGAGGNSLVWWQQIAHFSTRYRVLVFDHRLFGRSTCSSDDFQPSLFPSDFSALPDSAGIERVALLAQSMGGWTALPFSIEHPERVAALVLAGTPAGVFTPAVAENAARILALSAQSGIGADVALAPDFPEREPAMALLYGQIGGLNEAFEPALLARLAGEELRVTPERLEAFATPTLMLVGEQDQMFPPSVLREVAAGIPGARLQELPLAGHSTYFETPGAFNAAVDAFLDEHWPA